MNIPELTGGPLPVRDPEVYWVETVDGGQKVRFTVYSKSIWECWTHYNGRTKPCFEDRKFCEGGHDPETLRWYGYLFGWHHTDNKRAFLQLTVAAARQFLEQVQSGVSLRGMVIDVTRTGKKQGRLNVKVAQYMAHENERLGPDLCPKKSIFKFMKVKHVAGAYNLSLLGGPDDLPEDSKSA